MTKTSKLLRLSSFYFKMEIVKSFLTGFIFLLLPSALVIIIFVNIVVLYLPYLIYLFLVLYILLILIVLFSNKIVIETLKNYRDKSQEINYKVIYIKMVIISFIVITIAFLIGWLLYIF